MDGHREMESPLPLLQWLAGWVVIIGTCVLFWLAVYGLAVDWRNRSPGYHKASANSAAPRYDDSIRIRYAPLKCVFGRFLNVRLRRQGHQGIRLTPSPPSHF